MRLPGHRSAVRALAFDSSGERLASGGEDRAVVVWALAAVERELERLGLGLTKNGTASAGIAR
jgi:hypothetical protein